MNPSHSGFQEHKKTSQTLRAHLKLLLPHFTITNISLANPRHMCESPVKGQEGTLHLPGSLGKDGKSIILILGATEEVGIMVHFIREVMTLRHKVLADGKGLPVWVDWLIPPPTR